MSNPLLAVMAGLFGLCFGSFANVIGYRLPREESIVQPPSHCPQCGKNLSAGELIPILSWIFLRGRCKGCKEPISIRYPAVELACGLLFAAMALYTGQAWSLLPLSMLAFTLLCITLCDMDTQIIPDGLVIYGAVWGVLWVAVSFFIPIGAPIWWDALLGAVCGAGPLFLIDRLTILTVKKDAFGYGDVKLMLMTGLFLGWKMSLVSLFFGVILGGIAGVFVLRRKREEGGTYMAFGPFLAAGVLLALWFGNQVLEWYGGLFFR